MTTGRPGAAHIGLPFDVQKDPVDEADVWADKALGRYPVAPHRARPACGRGGGRAARGGASSPIFICGGGVVISGAEAELQALAELLGAPVATTISGQGSIADDAPARASAWSAATAARRRRAASSSAPIS